MHPASGAALLGLDWLIFGGNVFFAGLATPLACILGFVSGFAATAACQRFAAKDTRRKSLLKAVAGGLVVGLPFPIAGTAVGGYVIAASGLAAFRQKNLVHR